MNIIRLHGGIGNQLFQYAFGEYLRLTAGKDVKYDISAFGKAKSQPLRHFELEVLNRNIPVVENMPFGHRGLLNKLLRCVVCWMRGSKYLQGYWQKELYPNELLRNNPDFFAPRAEKPIEIQAIENEISANEQSVALHIRRGDYFSSTKAAKRYGVCDVEYYQKAIAFFLQQNRKNCKFFVFSDDLDWVKQHITLPEGTCYVPNHDLNSFWYIYLMSCCRHNIISNSSFSWWGAYLNKNNDKVVVCPLRWMLNSNKTIALEDWVKI
ncbi:alpha-1,2-fucosyltransferase [Bacteroidia bacterium]|nr:alpha-1,2-fucosyltransferase [Bacteroidia bacterium]